MLDIISIIQEEIYVHDKISSEMRPQEGDYQAWFRPNINSVLCLR